MIAKFKNIFKVLAILLMSILILIIGNFINLHKPHER